MPNFAPENDKTVPEPYIQKSCTSGDLFDWLRLHMTVQYFQFTQVMVPMHAEKPKDFRSVWSTSRVPQPPLASRWGSEMSSYPRNVAQLWTEPSLSFARNFMIHVIHVLRMWATAILPFPSLSHLGLPGSWLAPFKVSALQSQFQSCYMDHWTVGPFEIGYLFKWHSSVGVNNARRFNKTKQYRRANVTAEWPRSALARSRLVQP